ncbi:MAG: FumA C-terminus/TtdB family hydratase beta subunit [Candidatus Omnitrophota bacterium]
MRESKVIRLNTPLTRKDVRKLRAGQMVSLSGVIYTARDRAHKKLVVLAEKKKPFPFDFEGNIIYYCGPNFKDGRVSSCGPTTSSRMDSFIEPLIKKGLRFTIGKGNRASFVRDLLRRYKGVYFVTYAGCAAYLSRFVKGLRCLAYPQLGAEAIFEFKVSEFPLIVAIDVYGKDFYSRL